jgi:transaldolase
VRPFYDDAAEVMLRLKQAGVDYDDVVQVLEDEGVDKFIVSWNQLLEQIESKLGTSTSENSGAQK